MCVCVCVYVCIYVQVYLFMSHVIDFGCQSYKRI